jgi:hypothetical protein
MSDPTGNPDGPLWRYDPSTFCGPDDHDACRGVEKLISSVKRMRVAARIAIPDSDDRLRTGLQRCTCEESPLRCSLANTPSSPAPQSASCLRKNYAKFTRRIL